MTRGKAIGVELGADFTVYSKSRLLDPVDGENPVSFRVFAGEAGAEAALVRFSKHPERSEVALQSSTKISGIDSSVLEVFRRGTASAVPLRASRNPALAAEARPFAFA